MNTLFLLHLVQVHSAGSSSQNSPSTMRIGAIDYGDDLGLSRAVAQIMVNPFSPKFKVMTNDFKKIYENVRCADEPPLKKGPSRGGFEDCKRSCLGDPQCEFIVYYRERKWCESYANCATQQELDGDNVSSVWKRLSYCDVALDIYMREIPSFFPDGLIRASQPDPNLHCKCTSSIWMFCAIFARENTREWDILTTKLDRRDEENMKPFFILGTLKEGQTEDDRPIVYRGTKIHSTSINAEIEVKPTTKCFHINKCIRGSIDGVCGFTKKHFSSGDPVYVDKKRKGDIEIRGIPIPCYSLVGVRMADFELNLFSLYIVFDDKDMATGICDPGTSLYKNQPTDASDLFPPEPSSSSPSSLPFGSAGSPDSPSRSKKSKKKKGKSELTPGAASSPASEGSELYSISPDESSPSSLPQLQVGPAGSPESSSASKKSKKKKGKSKLGGVSSPASSSDPGISAPQTTPLMGTATSPESPPKTDLSDLTIEERVAESIHYPFRPSYALLPLLIVFTLYLYTSFSTSSHGQDVYIEFLHL